RDRLLFSQSGHLGSSVLEKLNKRCFRTALHRIAQHTFGSFIPRVDVNAAREKKPGDRWVSLLIVTRPDHRRGLVAPGGSEVKIHTALNKEGRHIGMSAVKSEIQRMAGEVGVIIWIGSEVQKPPCGLQITEDSSGRECGET